MTIVLCTCYSTLLGEIDFERLRSFFSDSPLVEKILVSDRLCEKNVFENLGLDDDRVVVAACSTRLLEAVFKGSGVFNGLVEFVNIREQCAKACGNREEATWKAIRLVKGAVQKALHAEPLSTEGLKIVKEALVIGGGIAGVRCALDIADAGYRVYLVEKEPSIG
ncbi:MAG: FAD-binding protein, partial [Thermoproteota archaeon]